MSSLVTLELKDTGAGKRFLASQLVVNGNVLLIAGGKARGYVNASVLDVVWYAVVDGEDGLQALELVACGTSALDGNTIRMRDVEGQEQGTVDVKGLQLATVAHAFEESSLVPQLRNVARDKGLPTSELFASVKLHVPSIGWHSVPLLSFAQPALKGHSKATDVFERFLELALAFAHPTQTDDASLLADMLAVPSLAWLYRPDTTRAGRDNDTWQYAWAMPLSNGMPLAMDCEDAAKALYDLALLFQSLELASNASPRLRQLQVLARLYTPYMAIGELKSHDAHALTSSRDDAYVLHAFVVMLAKDKPSLSLEGTSYASGAWLAHTHDAEDVRVYTELSRRAETTLDAKANEVAKIRSPMSMVRDQRMYRRLIALFTHQAHYLAPAACHVNDFLLAPNLSTLYLALSVAQGVPGCLASCVLPQPPAHARAPPKGQLQLAMMPAQPSTLDKSIEIMAGSSVHVICL